MTGAIAVEKSTNSKLGTASTTWASQGSCPITCPFLGSGCYAEHGPAAFVTRRLNKATEMTSLDIAKQEAAGIDKLSGWLPLRLHSVGDCQGDEEALLVSAAAKRYNAKHGAPVWTYTHSWREVRRSSWGGVSVLASCETPEAARYAMELGYAASMVTGDHPGPAAYAKGGVKVVPCPEQTGKSANCESCKLCWRDDKLLNQSTVIGFAAHGSRKNTVKTKLIQLGAAA